MRTPDEVLDQLSMEQVKQVEEIERTAEERLKKSGEITFNIMETIKTIDEVVWKEVVKNANKAGWRASINGPIVTIKRPEGR